jgi:hypothetical protein
MGSAARSVAVSGGPYEVLGRGYAAGRRTDQRIAARLCAALGDARSVVNIGAGTGSYEPPGRTVGAVEPSAVMRAQRPPGAAPCLAAVAESLPFAGRVAGAVPVTGRAVLLPSYLACPPVRNRRGTGRGPDAGAFRALRAS